MSKLLKVAAITGVGVLIAKTLQTANTVKNLNFTIGKIYKNTTGKGYKMSLLVTNPTSGIVTLDFPYISIKIDGSTIADNTPSAQKIVIQPNQRTSINDVALKADNLAILQKLLTITSNKKVEVFVRSAINGTVANLKIGEFPVSQLQSLSGFELGLVASGVRKIKDGSKYDSLFPKASNTDTIHLPDGNVKDTVKLMEERVRTTLEDTTKIAKMLDGKSIYQTSKNIWEFLYNHIQYKLDEQGIEQLRRPRRSWADRKTGIDCDCFSIFASSILTNLGIEHKFIVTKYNAGWQHVYVIVPDSKNRTQYIIDCVLDQFNVQKPYSDRFFHNMESLSGIPISFLNGIDQNTTDELVNIVNGVDFNEVLQQETLSGIASPQALNKAMFNHLLRTRNYIAKNPRLYKVRNEAIGDVKMLDYALDNWHNEQSREAALGVLIANEQKFNTLAGLGSNAEDNLLGKGFFKKVASVVAPKVVTPARQAKAPKGIFNKVANVVKTVVRANPVVRTIQRTGSGVMQRLENRGKIADAKDAKRTNILQAKGAAKVAKQQAQEKKRVNKIAAKSFAKVAKKTKQENKSVFKNLKKADRRLTKANDFANQASQFRQSSAFVDVPNEVAFEQAQYTPQQNVYDVEQAPVDEFAPIDTEIDSTLLQEEPAYNVQQDYIAEQEYNEFEDEAPEEEEYEEDALEEEEEMQGVLSGVDFFGEENLNGTDEVNQLECIHDHLVRTHNALAKKFNNGKTVLGSAQADKNYINMLGRAVDSWNGANLLGVLTELANEEERWNIVSGLGAVSDDAEDELGKPVKKQFFKRVKNVVQKIKAGAKPMLKKVGRAIVRYNPLSLAARGGFLLGLKVNIFKIAERLYPAYLTPQQAKQQGFSATQIADAKRALAKVEKMFVGRLKGTSIALKNAVLTGRAAKKISKATLKGLGAAGADDAAIIITAAAPLLTAFIATSPSRQANRIARQNLSGSTDSLMGIGEGFEPTITDADTNFDANTIATEQAQDADVVVGKELAPQEKQQFASSLAKFITAIKNWLAARKAGKDANSLVAPDANDPLYKTINEDAPKDDTSSEKGFLESVKDFVMENPLQSAAIAGAVVLVVSPSARKAIGIGGSTQKSKPALSGLNGTPKHKALPAPKKQTIKSITLK